MWTGLPEQLVFSAVENLGSATPVQIILTGQVKVSFIEIEAIIIW